MVVTHFLLSVIFQGPDCKYTSTSGTTCLKANGTINFKAHNFIILAIGKLSHFGLSWQTILLCGDYIWSDKVQANMNGGLPIPLNKIPSGGGMACSTCPLLT